MKVSYKGNIEVIEYDSLNDFYKYICETPFNEAFRWNKHGSVDGSEYFTKTKDFAEATELFKNGWSDMATKLVQKLKVAESKKEPIMKAKPTLSMAGYQAVVPLYLNGVPNNMVNKKMVPVKQKVVTLNKSIDYAGGVDTDTIIDESIKAMQIVKKLESQGLRVNLNIVIGSKVEKSFIVKIRIKSATEKLNVSKLAFPLVHPSMLRRLLFRWIEVYPNITKGFTSGYGRPATTEEQRQMLDKGEYLIPSVIKKDMSKINSIDDLEMLEYR